MWQLLFRSAKAKHETRDMMESSPVIVVTFLLWISFSSAATINICPFQNPDPCDCSQNEDSTYSSVTCKGVPSNRKFVEMVNKIKQAKNPAYKESVHYLYLYSSSVNTISTTLFEGLRLRAVTINNTAFMDQRMAVGTVFQALRTTLDQLYLSNCRLTSQNLLNLHLLPQLRRIIVSRNTIPLLSTNLFLQPSENIREIYFYNNKIEKLEPYTFMNARRLKILLLNENRIDTWDRSYLPNPAEELQELHLRRNKLETLPDLMFLNMPRLTLVDLSENNIQHLPETLWQPAWKQLKDIYLKGNPIRCDCKLEWLVHEEAALPQTNRQERFLYATCSAPRHILGKKIEDLRKSDMSCPM